MKKIIFAALFLASIVSVNAQNDFLLTEQLFSRIATNPAGTGNSENVNAFYLGRLQWSGFTGAPVSNLLNVHFYSPKMSSGFGASFSYDESGIAYPDLNAKLVGESVAQQIEKRIPYKRAMKQAIFRVMKNGAIGVKIMCSGRLNGAEIARTEWFREGRLPLHSIRAKVDYCCTTAHTKFGCIGIKVWIYTGDVSTDSAGLPALLS